MRLHRLEFSGFGPFLRRQVVNFDDFVDDGLFLISGRTGAGKSSILDAVCFALYGSIPRYGSGEKRIRSDHALPEDPTSVTLEFTTSGATYKVTRSPEYERPKARGEGTTLQKSEVELWQKVGDEWHGLAARAVDVANALDEILQLTKDQFLQVILLAQNRFAQFLFAKNDERRDVLRTLFGTKRFEDYQHSLEARRKASDDTMARNSAVIEERLAEAERLVRGASVDDQGETSSLDPVAALSTVAERLEYLDTAISRAKYREETAALELTRADEQRAAAAATLVTVRADRDAQIRRDNDREKLARLERDAAHINADRGSLSRARRAISVRGAVAAAARSDEHVATAHAAVEAAQAAWPENADRPGESVTELQALLDATTTEIGGLAHAAQAESDRARLVAECDAANADQVAATERVSRLENEEATFPAQLAALRERIAMLVARSERIELLEALEASTTVKLNAALEASRARELADEAEAKSVTDNGLSARAAIQLDELYQRKHRGSASELAALLVDGAPCPVCGAAEHPAPAPASEDPVTQADIDAAIAQRDAAAATAADSGARAKRLAEKLASLLATSDGRDSDALAEDLAAVTGDLAAARQAALDANAARAEERALHERSAGIAAEIAAARSAASDCATAATLAKERLDATDALIQTARATFGSVAERVQAANRLRAAVDALLEARRTLLAAQQAQGEAADALTVALVEGDFSDREEAVAAVRTDGEIEQLQSRITDYDADLRAVKGSLLELEMRLLPDEPIDVAVAVAADESAQLNWAQAALAVQATASAAAQLVDQVEQVRSLLGSHAAAVQAHETIVRLSDTVAGRAPNNMRMSLETFVLAAELEEIVAAANVRLTEMSSGRYRLEHSDERAARGAASGLGIDVFDSFTSRSRPAHSLSGGETFLASLALALGLAEVVTSRAGGVRLDTLFIDEGFGSLDPATLDVAMHTLDELRAGGRTVGVISHVEAMKEQIPAQLRVEVSSDGSSEVR